MTKNSDAGPSTRLTLSVPFRPDEIPGYDPEGDPYRQIVKFVRDDFVDCLCEQGIVPTSLITTDSVHDIRNDRYTESLERTLTEDDSILDDFYQQNGRSIDDVETALEVFDRADYAVEKEFMNAKIEELRRRKFSICDFDDPNDPNKCPDPMHHSVLSIAHSNVEAVLFFHESDRRIVNFVPPEVRDGEWEWKERCVGVGFRNPEVAPWVYLIDPELPYDKVTPDDVYTKDPREIPGFEVPLTGSIHLIKYYEG